MPDLIFMDIFMDTQLVIFLGRPRTVTSPRANLR